MRARPRSTQTLAVLALGLACLPLAADPMKPLTALPTMPSPAAEVGAPAPADGLAHLHFSATRSDASGRWEALLGTQWRKRGEAFDGARVIEIDANRVLLLRDGRRETLFLLPPLSAAWLPARPPLLLPEKPRAPAAPPAPVAPL